MHFTFKSFLIAAVLSSISFTAARAEIFYVEDQGDRFSMSFPDSWEKLNNQKPDDKLVIAGAGVNDFATCRMRVRKDERFLIYPGKFDSDIQKTEYSREFWDTYLGDYNDVNVDTFKDESGLGFGHASMAEVSFETAEGAIVRKRGIMFASLYRDQAYIVDCSSEASVYQKWRPAFMSIIKSIDFKKVTHERQNGHYRDFGSDGSLKVQGPKQLDVYKF